MSEILLTHEWQGLPVTLQPLDAVVMPQTPNGSFILAYLNKTGQNSRGSLTYTSGGGGPVTLPVSALTDLPSIWIDNWRGNQLKLTNTSTAAVDIWIRAFGVGVVGLSCSQLTAPVTISTTECVQGTTTANAMRVVLSTPSTTDLTTMAIIAGPPGQDGSNAYVVALNATADTGPGIEAPSPPPGLHATTKSNTYTFAFSTEIEAEVYVANFSQAGTAAVKVTLEDQANPEVGT